MRPIKSLAVGLTLSACMMLGGGWLSAYLPAEGQVGRDISAVAAPEHDGLLVEVRGVRNGKGHIVVTVYDDAEALTRYDDELVADYAIVPAKEGVVTAEFPNLTKGPYAVVIFHDENDDQDFRMEGDVPLEGYGTSGARSAYDEPGFERAAVPPGGVAVDLYYLR